MKTKRVFTVVSSILVIAVLAFVINLLFNTKSVAIQEKEKVTFDIENSIAEKLLECVNSEDDCIVTSGNNQMLYIYTSDLEEVVNVKTQHLEQINSISISNDRKYIVTADKKGCLAVWDLIQKNVSYIKEAHVDDITNTDFSPNSNTFASTGKDRTIIIWDINTLKIVNVLKGHKSYINDIDFSPDGSKIASVGVDNNLIIWDVASGKKVKSKGNSHFRAVNQVEYSSDGQYLFTSSADSLIKKWNTENLTLDNTFKGHSNEVLEIVLDNNNNLYSAGRENAVLCFNTLAGNKETSINIKNNLLTTGLVVSEHTDELYIGDLSGDIISVNTVENTVLKEINNGPVYAMTLF